MRRLQWLVWNRSERRLRAPWRLLFGAVLFVLVSIVTILALQILPVISGFGLLASVSPAIQPLVLNAIVGGVIVLMLVAIAWNIDRRPVSDYGLDIDREWWVDCGVGLLVGAAAMSAIVLLGIAGGWFAVEAVGPSTGSLSTLLGLVCVFLIVGFYEELLIRGFLLTNIAEGSQWFEAVSARTAAILATLISAGIFGGLHATNPNATLVSTLVISAAGVMLALGYLYTGELAIPIGIHITWNAFQGLVYGLPVSGAELPVSLVATTARGPEIVSGGAFGPEAGLLGLLGVVFAAFGVVVYCRYRYGTLGITPAVTTPQLRSVPSTAE